MSLHIFRGIPTTTELEVEQLNKLDKYQKRYLKGLGCTACGMSLANTGCGDVLPYYAEDFCSESVRIIRRDKALKQYKPRCNQRKRRTNDY